MSQLNKWMTKSKISKLVIVITSKETGEHVERWQFDVDLTAFLNLRELKCARCKYLIKTPSSKEQARLLTKRIHHLRESPSTTIDQH